MEDTVRRAILVVALTLGFWFAPRWAGTMEVAAGSAQSRACVYDHQGLRTAHGLCRPRARAYPADVVGAIRRSIYDAALTFSIPYPLLMQIAQCESGLNPRATNGTHFGLYQFLPATFRHGAANLKRETGIKAKSYWNPLDASYVAGYLFVQGQIGRWSCATPPSRARLVSS